jgi:hypothetical protein
MNKLKPSPMKTKITLFLAAVMLLTGCDLFKNAAELTITTNLTADIPVIVAPGKAADLFSEATAVNFSGTSTLTLAGNHDIADYLEKIREIDLKSVVITINGLSAGQTINTITVAVAGSGELGTQTNISFASNSFTPAVNASVYSKAEADLLADQEITVTATGTASGAMSFTVHLNFTSAIVVGALD